MNRRELIGVSAGCGLSSALLPAWARSDGADLSGLTALDGSRFDLTVSTTPVRIDGRKASAILVNEALPAPLLRWREGDTLTVNVRNRLKRDTSIHWHGILLPFHMDGVPGLSFPGIKPGETFTYRFTLRQAGTYWYHSHSGLQEQAGHYGPIIVEPANGYAEPFDREYIVQLSDWTFENPHRVFSKLKKMSDNYNYQQRTIGDFIRDARRRGFDPALADRRAWGAMRMNPTDIADVTGATYTYLVNGQGPNDNWTGLFTPGERVRLRFINSAAMSIFNVRIPGLPMTVVAADGLDVKPVTIDEFQIGTAETFDVIVEPSADAYTLVAESNDRSGMARATLAARPGLLAPVPSLRARPTLTMKDMAMDHGAHAGMDHTANGHDKHASKKHNKHTDMDHSAMDHDKHAGMHVGMDHAAMGHDKYAGMEEDKQHETVLPTLQRGPGVVNIAENPVNRLHERPLGLEDEPHRVLVYTDLKSREPNPDKRVPSRTLQLHLTSNMERYMWSFDGIKYSEVDGPIVFHEGERVRLTLTNNTMMPHPIHLHGMFFDVVTNDGPNKPRKHTVVVKPGERMSVDITADEPGDWAFHCHLLYHMHAGMMRTVSVRSHKHG
ncbi:MAG: copper resistance system multicopper oxidase [Pseudomonadota bacterium]